MTSTPVAGGVALAGAILDKCSIHVVAKAGCAAATAYGPVFLADNVLSVGPHSYQNATEGVAVRVGEGGSIVFSAGAEMAPHSAVSDLYIEAGGTVSHAVVQSGASLTIAPGGRIIDKLVVKEGGIVTIHGGVGGVVELQGETNIGLSITGTDNPTVEIKGFAHLTMEGADCITLPDIASKDITGLSYPDADHVTLHLANEKTFTLAIEGVQKHDFRHAVDKMAAHKNEVCFLAGALLRTPEGDRAVETLKYGDALCTYDWRNNTWETRQIVWAGQRTTTVRPGLPDDEAGYPVRILKDAIADGVPYQDLLVTAEHSLFFENVFVPARMLVNGRSIFFDRSITSYTYYHVEIEPHAVILANGVLTETYLDTTSRRLFYQTGDVVALRFSKLSWKFDAAAPLALKRPEVEPLYVHLAQRAQEQGYPVHTPPLEVTADPELFLVTDRGQTISRARKIGSTVMFMVPTEVRAVRIMSRTNRLTDSIGPFINDRRPRGVMIGDITYLDNASSRLLSTHLHKMELDGWAAFESTEGRWTTGNAFLPLPLCGPAGFAMLSLKILAGGPYICATLLPEDRAQADECPTSRAA